MHSTYGGLLQQLSLGLVIPALQLTRWSIRQSHTSMPVVYTTLKMVVRRHTDAVDAGDNELSEWQYVNRRSRKSLYTGLV